VTGARTIFTRWLTIVQGPLQNQNIGKALVLFNKDCTHTTIPGLCPYFGFEEVPVQLLII